MHGFAVVDLETTGLSPEAHHVVELGVVTLDSAGSVTGEWTSLVGPPGAVAATHVHGISPEELDGAPAFSDLAPALLAGLGERCLVAHNAPFDLVFLQHELARAGREPLSRTVYCTLELSRHFQPRLRRRRLSDCCRTAGIDLDAPHCALADAHATAALLAGYLALASDRCPRDRHGRSQR